jgi:Fe-S-cluster containining protein
MKNDCSQCGLCCRLFLINLTKEEYLSGKYKTQLGDFGAIDNFKKATTCGANILKQKKDESCIYLKDNQCSIHKIRPQACREFFCSSKQKRFQGMIKEIKEKQINQKV